MFVNPSDQQAGFTLIEVLVTLVIIAIGLLGLGALQLNTMNNSFDTYQRALVGSIVDDMAARIRMNSQAARAGDYFAGRPEASDCERLVGAQRDLCGGIGRLMVTAQSCYRQILLRPERNEASGHLWEHEGALFR